MTTYWHHNPYSPNTPGEGNPPAQPTSPQLDHHYIGEPLPGYTRNNPVIIENNTQPESIQQQHSNPVISANNLVVDQIPGFIHNYSFDTTTPPYTILDPSDPYEAITRQFQIPANDVVKLVIGQVPYPIVNEQLANLMHAMTDVWPLSVGAHTVPWNRDTVKNPCTDRRRTGMWFVHIKKECADRFTDLDRRVAFRADRAAMYEHEAKDRLWKAYKARQDQAVDAGQPKTLLPMTVKIATEHNAARDGVGRSTKRKQRQG